MPDSENTIILSSGRSLSDPDDDDLGYAPFAQHLAESICNMVPPEGLVIAIYGAWGSGKSTLLNFTLHYLGQKPEGEQPIIVPFNPWWFSGHEDLARHFFDQLQAKLNNKRKQIAKSLRNRIADLADMISETSIPYASQARPFAQVIRPRRKDIQELKAKISKELKIQHRRFLIVVDDIDRLTVDEIRQLFVVIKAVADFPNVIYLLAFDKRVVVSALEEAQKDIPGEEFIGKIVQVPFELPMPDELGLQRMFFRNLSKLGLITEEDFNSETYFRNVYVEGIQRCLRTPRDVIRLTNTLSVTYPAVKGEANRADFIAIETLRVFYPEIYDLIRNNRDMFTGHSENAHQFDALNGFHETWIQQVSKEEQLVMKRFLRRLFPKLKSVWEKPHSTSSAQSTIRWRKQLRICSPDIFPIYFRLSIPNSSISNAEMKSLLNAIKNKTLEERLLGLSKQKLPNGTSRVGPVLDPVSWTAN